MDTTEATQHPRTSKMLSEKMTFTNKIQPLPVFVNKVLLEHLHSIHLFYCHLLLGIGKWPLIPVFLSLKIHGQRSLVDEFRVAKSWTWLEFCCFCATVAEFSSSNIYHIVCQAGKYLLSGPYKKIANPKHNCGSQNVVPRPTTLALPEIS